MGFMDSFGDFFSGSSKSGGSQQATSGFSLLPKQIQDAYTTYGSAVNSQIPNATSAYTPLGQTPMETSGYQSIEKGFTPTADSLNSDLSMLMNPFNSSVIDQINRQANSDYSVLKQNSSLNGQFGSNRQQLGANDIENSRQSNIGSLLQNQYNQALGQVFNNLVPQRQQDAQNKISAAGNARAVNLQASSAPITGLQQIGTALGILPNTGGAQSSGEQSSQTHGGLLGWL